MLHGHPKFVCQYTNRPAAHQPQQSGKKAQLLKAQPPKAPPPNVRSKTHVAPSGQPMKAPPWGLRPEIPAPIELPPPKAQPNDPPPPTPPIAYHPCREVADYLMDSDDDSAPPPPPEQRSHMTSPTPKHGSAVSAQLGGYLTSPPPKQLRAGCLVQTAGSAYPAGSAQMATAGQDARGWIYIPPKALSNAKVCPPCMQNLRALSQPAPDGFDPAGFYLRAGVYWMAGVCISCRNEFESFSQHAPAPVTHAPHEHIAPQPPVPTLHEVLAPPPPVVSARKEKPAKGCDRYGGYFPSGPVDALSWPKPPVPKRSGDAGDGALWRQIEVRQYPKKPWRDWGSGVVDLRPRKNMVIGKLMRNAIMEAAKMIRNIPCEHKIGMCRCPYERFWLYQKPDELWKPWLLGLLASTNTREGASTMEASIIFHIEQDGMNIDNNYNWTVSMDYGGEGPKHEDQAHLEHFVYIALKPLPPRTSEEQEAAASARLVASGQAAVL